MAKLLGGTRIYGNLIIDTNVAVNGTNVAISNTTGAIVAAGGIGLAGNIYAGGNIVLNSAGATVTQVWASANDSAAQPGYAWSGDTAAGMFQAAANTIGFTTVGVERARITNIGNLLVGTTATTLGSNSTVVISGLGTNGGGIELVGGGQSGGGNISALSGGGINFGTFTGAVGAEAYTERARFVPNGNLLIGTRVNPAGGNATVVIQGVGTNGGGAEFVGASGSGGGNISAMSGGGLTFSTFTGAVGSEVYTDRMRLNTTSNILINTALNPLGGNATVVVSGLGTNGGGIELVGGGQTGGGNISAMTAGGMTFGTFTGVVGAESYAERMRIEPTGNVGIGTTTSSNARVTIETANAGVSTGTIALMLQTRAGSVGTYVDLAAATYNGFTNTSPGTIRFIDDGNFSNNIAFRTKLGGAATNADVERMRIYSTGNIGIGTSTAPLGGNATVVINGVGTNGGGIELVGGSTSGGANISGMSAGGLTISTFTGLVGAEVYTNRMIVNNAGNLLINTALNPLGGNATVVVGGIGTNGGGIELVGSTTGGGNISGMGNGGLTISTFTGAVGSEVYTNRMVVNNAGNLLINTALNPLGGNATVVVGGIGTNGGGIELVGGGASGGGNISALAAGGLTVGTFTGAVGAESYAERMRIASDGNIGVNTATTTNAKFSIVGGTGSAGELYLNAGTNFIRMGSSLSGGSYNSLVQAGDQALIFSGGTQTTTGALVIGPWTALTQVGLRMPAGGNLLIGTATSPLTSTAVQVINSTNGGGTEWVNNNSGGGNVSAISAGGLAFGTFTGAVGAEVVTERMRLAANGKFLVGTTIAPVGAATNLFLNASTGGGIQFGNNNTSGSNISVGFGNGIVFSSYTGVGGSETYTQRAMISGLTGNLLIGTATLPAGGNATVVVAGLGTNGGGIELVGSTTGGGNISGMGNGGLTFSTFTGAVGSEVYADRMRITALGNVGIGTATVGTGNTVAVFGGNIYVGSTNSGIVFPDGTYQSTAYGTSASGVTSFAAGTTGMTPTAATTGAVTLAFGTSATAQGIYSPTTNQIALSTASTARLLINANGNVLVGTTTAPAGSNATVVIASTGTNGGGIELVGSTTGGGNISAMTGGGLTVSTFTGAVGSEVYTNRMVVNNAGNLLINTALNPLGGNATVVIAGLGTNGGGAEYVGGGGSGGGNVSGLGNGGLVWSTFTGTVGAEVYAERMRLAAGGKLLVGATIAPVGAATNLFLNASTGGGVQFGNNNTSGSNISVGFGNGIVFSSYTGVGGSETYTQRAMISGLTGNLLVGTTALPAGGNATVVVTGLGTNGGGIELVGGGASGGGNISGMGNGGLTFSTFTGAVGSEVYADRMRITALGNIGIGTATVGTGNTVAVFGGNIYVGSTNSGIVFADGTYQSTAYGTSTSGVTSFAAGTTGMTPTTATTGAVTLAFGTSATAQGIYSPTTNQIALSTASTARLLINANGNVLVGTTTAPAGGTVTLVLQGVGTNGGGIQFANVNAAGSNIGIGASNSMVFSTYTGAAGSEVYTERMRLISGGNILVGTATAPLGGNATVVIAGLGTNGGGAEYVGGGGSGGGNVSGLGNGGLVWSTFTGAVGAEAYTERMRLSASGTFGIATAAPLSTLDVNGVISARTAFSTAGSAAVASVTSNGTVTGTAFVPSSATIPTNGIFLPATDTVGVAAGSTERMRVTTTGVGFGGAQQSSFNVTVNGGALGTVANSQVRMLNIYATDTNASSLEFSDVRNASGGADWTTAGMRMQQKIDATYMGWVGFNNGNTVTTNNGGISFGTGTSTLGPNGVPEVMRITSTGLVGIATVSPGSTLDVNGVISARTAFSTAGAATVASLTSNGSISGTTGTFSNATGPQISLTGATSNWIGWNGNGLAAPTFTSSSAGTKLILYPNVGVSAADFAIGIESNTLWNSVSTTGNQFKWYGGTTQAMLLSGAGALTTTSTTTSTAFIPTGAAAPTNGMFLPAANTLGFATNSAEGMRLAPNGNLLVGLTTLPAGGNATVVLEGLGTNGGGIELLGGSASGGGLVSGLSAGGMAFATFTGVVGSEVYTERMRIDVNGNVGIATTNAPTGNIFAVYGRSFHAGNVQIANTTVGGAGIFFPDGTYQATAATGSGGVSSFSGGTTGFTPAVLTTGSITLAGTLIAANGGTGFNTYVIGDILYASTTTALSRLAAVATGQVIVSAGAGTAPAYSGTPTLASLTLNTASGPQLTFSGATSNFLTFGTVGSAVPAFTTRSVGTKAVFNSNITAITTDYAIGIANASTTAPLSTAPGTLWYSVPAANILHQFQWYGGTTALATLWGNGNLAVTGEVTAYFSDSRLKDNVTVITDAVDKVKQIRGVYYHASDAAVDLLGEDKTVQKVGLLAQEVEAILPNVIRPAPFDVGTDGLSKSGENYLTLQYERVIPLLVQAIKEQQTQIELLEARIARLEPKS